MLNLRLALRNVARHRRRSAMAIGAVAFGTAAMLLASGFIEWIFHNFREYSIHSQLGHIQISRQVDERRAAASNLHSSIVPADSPAVAAVARDPNVELVAPRLSFNGFISAGDATLSFIGEGVDPDKERELSVSITTAAGQPLDAGEPSGIVLGEGLAANIGVKPGDNVVLLVAPQSGSVSGVDAHVRGTFFSVTKAYDDSALRVPLPLAERLLHVRGAQRWLVLLRNTDETPSVLASLRAGLRGQDIALTPWWELADFYNKTVTLFSRQLDVIKVVIAIIVVLSISNTMMMNVLERTREIGTSMALGTPRRKLLGQYLAEGLFLGLLGGFVGLLLGSGLAGVLTAIGIPMPPPPGMRHGFTGGILLEPVLALEALALAVAATLAASIYPAHKASRMAIVDALRHNR